MPAKTSLFVLLAVASIAFAQPATPGISRPPRGWDSYDSNPIWANQSIDETTLLLQAEALFFLAKDPSGAPSFPNIIIDEGWAESSLFGWILDDFGRPIVNPILFPSAAGGAGFAPLSKKLRDVYQMTLGLWMIKGIPALAYELNLPVFGTNYTARDIVVPGKVCSWHPDMLYVDGNHPGGQAYYNSLAELYSSWGVGYIKIDCIFADDLDASELNAAVTAFRYAIVEPTNRSVVISLSPGFLANTTVANTFGRTADLYRVTDDLWDCWSLTDPRCLGGVNVTHSIRRLVNFSRAGLLDASLVSVDPYPGRRSYPDPDMLAFGGIQLGGKGLRHSLLSVAQQRLMLGLWSITLSPIILGGYIAWMDNTIVNALGQPLMWAVHQQATAPTLLHYNDDSPSGAGVSVWQSTHAEIEGAFFVGVFPFTEQYNATFSVTTRVTPRYPGAAFPSYDVYDCFTGDKLFVATANATLNATSQVNDASALWFFLPRA